MEDKKVKAGNVAVGICLFVIAILLVLIVVFFYNTTMEKNNLQDKISELETKIEEKDNESFSDMSIELAYGILNKYKEENLPDANWYITDVKLVAHGDNNTYLVDYSSYNLDGYEENAGTIIEYKNGEWTTELPGFTGISDEEISKYNFVNY